MKCGYFDDDKREYVITSPHTPVKWINYIGTLAFGGLVDHTGGTVICKGDPALNRIVKYIPQMPASDFKGETLYIRIKESSGYKIFSPFYVPTLDAWDRFECRVGLGYSRWITEFYGIRCEITVFVPLGRACEIRDIRITNLREKPVELDVAPVVEFTHFNALKQFNNADWVPQTLQSKAIARESGKLLLLQYAFMHKDTQLNYTTSNRPVSSFETDRKIFLGLNEYGTFRRPLSLNNPELSNTEALRGDNLHVLLHCLEPLPPGHTKELVFMLGQAENPDAIKSEIDACCGVKQVKTALGDLSEWWENYLALLQVNTPDPSLNTMINIHNPRQCYITKNWSRYLSLYQLGLGARGIGFRDSSQDSLGVIDRVPEEAAALLEMLLKVQRRDGSAMHQFNPLTMEANEGDSRAEEDAPGYYGDDHLWSVLAVCAYLKETGNMAFLEKEVPYYDKDKNDQPLEWATVLDHLCRALDFTRTNKGEHNIPLLGFADWNDSVNLKKGSESFMVANLFGTALREMIGLMSHLGRKQETKKYRKYYTEIKTAFGKTAWDGKWFRRYLDWDGSPIGSSQNSEGKIFCNGQSWPVISGFASPTQAKKALQAVHDKLNTSCGIKLSTPGYNGFDPAKGGVTTYPPGAKENGGIFLHANPWVIIAETLNGNGDRAFDYYNQINPAARNESIEIFECEPYVYPQNILGDEHPQFGLARNSWLSGTSAWMYTAATKFILGIRPDYEGLCIHPCIPKAWKQFKITRKFRGALYHIHVENPDGVCRGIRAMTMNGQPVSGGCVPVAKPGQTVDVRLILGKAKGSGSVDAAGTPPVSSVL